LLSGPPSGRAVVLQPGPSMAPAVFFLRGIVPRVLSFCAAAQN
jgi:hypothetical protein